MSQKYALIIGNSCYNDPSLAEIQATNADVKRLAEVLRNPNIANFDDVRELSDQSESVVKRAISTFFANKKADNLLLLYFSGHGLLDEQGRLYLATTDTQRDLIRATSI